MRPLRYIMFVLFLLLQAQTLLAGPTLDDLAEQVTKPKTQITEYEVGAFAPEIAENISEGGKWADGNPGLFSLGNPDITKLYEADYEWLSYLPEEALKDEDEKSEKVKVAEYEWNGAELASYDVEISKRSYYAQTAACNRVDKPYTHSHTYRALHSYSNYGLGWPSQKALLGSGGLVLPPGMSGSIAETGPTVKAILELLGKIVPVSCKNPITKVTYECVHKAEYLPLQSGLYGNYDPEIGFPSGYCINIQYPMPLGTDFVNIATNPLGDCCPLRVDITHSIDYLFPTAKINLSKQQQVSRYIPVEDVNASTMGLSGTIYSVKRWLKLTADYLKATGVLGSRYQIQVATGEKLPDLQEDDERQYELTVFDEGQEWKFPWGDWNYPWTRSTRRGFLRYLIEIGVMRDYRLTPFAPSTYFYPHVWPGWGPEFWGGPQIFGQSQYFTDAFAGPFYAFTKGIALSFWLSESRKISSEDYRKHFQTPEQCVRHNAATEKTPEDYLLSICPEENEQCREAWTAKRAHSTEPRKDFNDPCLDNVGEIFPVTAYARPYNSDYIMQTIAKGLRQYMSLYRETINRFSFDRTLDRFHFYPTGKRKSFPRDKYAEFRSKRLEESISDIYSEKIEDLEEQLQGLTTNNSTESDQKREDLQELLDQLKKQQEEFEIPQELNDKLNVDVATEYQCELFDEVNSKPGYAFQAVNKNTPEVIGAHGEVSGEIFTNFSGCWAYPGNEDWYLDPANTVSGVLRILPSYWDSREEHLRVR